MHKRAIVSPAAREPGHDHVLDLKELTEARVSLGRFGAGLPTRAAQSFLLDHARAREAVWSQVDRTPLVGQLEAIGLSSVCVDSRAGDRGTYIRRPDLGRQLSDASLDLLLQQKHEAGAAEIVIVVADGLSSSAVETNAIPLIRHLAAIWGRDRLGPIVLAAQGRVALGDPVGHAMSAKLTVMLIGERPGLSAADSLGAYITYAPKPGTPDSLRNCVSNIRESGLACELAARTIADLVDAATQTGITGVGLKEAIARLERGRTHHAVEA